MPCCHSRDPEKSFEAAAGRIRRMRFTLEFADSEVRDVTLEDGTARVRFAAASVRDADGAHGWMPGVVLALSEATLAGEATHAFGRIAQGRLRHDAHDVPCLALPGKLAGRLELALRFANDTWLTLNGRTLALSLPGDALSLFKEDLSC